MLYEHNLSKFYNFIIIYLLGTNYNGKFLNFSYKEVLFLITVLVIIIFIVVMVVIIAASLEFFILF